MVLIPDSSATISMREPPFALGSSAWNGLGPTDIFSTNLIDPEFTDTFLDIFLSAFVSLEIRKNHLPAALDRVVHGLAPRFSCLNSQAKKLAQLRQISCPGLVGYLARDNAIHLDACVTRCGNEDRRLLSVQNWETLTLSLGA